MVLTFIFICICVDLLCEKQNGHMEIVEFLLKKGANAHFDRRDHTNPISIACGVCIILELISFDLLLV